MTNIFLACAMAFLFLLAGCDSSRVYETNVEFPEKNWKIADEVAMDFEIKDTTKRYNVYFNVRNSIEYPYARLFVNYTLVNPKGVELEKKMVGNNLFDQKTGEPFGQSGIGDLFDHQFPLLKNYKFHQEGHYKIVFEQFMRKDTLEGVLAVGARVEVAENKNQ
ncbi:MAG: gliding motility lipoprotein GldH [Flammeovirgaceae bacterium]